MTDQDTSRLQSTINISGLDHSVTRDYLYQVCIPFGEIISVQMPESKRQQQQQVESAQSNLEEKATAVVVAAVKSSHNNRGFAFVEYEESQDALAAVDNLDQSEIAGRVVWVKMAKKSTQEFEGLGSKKAVWEQEGWLQKYAVDESDIRQDENDPKEMSLSKSAHYLETGVAGPAIAE